MSIEEFKTLHQKAALEIMADNSLSTVGTAEKRADQAVVGMRHLLCCWILVDATESQLAQLAQGYSP